MAQQASSRKSQAENTMTTTTTAAEMMSRNGEDESQQQAAMVAASEEAADDPFGHFRQQQSQQHPDQQQQPAKMQVRSSQVDQDELVRLVQVEAMQLPDLGLVVSGMSGRFPKCDSVNEFEENLREGRDMVNDQDNSRFTCGLWNLPPRAGRLKDLSRFDNEFFGFTLEEANYIDFQLRILYEVVYESILDAGLNPAELRGTNTGVFFGLHCNEFENAMADDPAFKTNGYYAQFAIKVAQYFDLRGITVTFDAACASGFVGLHNAVEALRDGIVEQAIVCSSNIPVHPTGSFIFYQMQMLSPTGYSRFLDSRADGYVKSEACVSIVLQRQHLAKRNYASFMATMTSVDGYKPEGITFPSDKSQETLIRGAKELAGVSTNHVEYLEAHGTGTPAGDPQEARAISNVYYSDDQTDGGEKRDPGDGEYGEEDEEESNRRDEEQGGSHRQVRAVVPNNNRQLVAADRRRIGPLLVGSVKTNMGHSEAASGLCALVKVTLMLENELIYKNLHFDQPNTNIEPLMDGRLRFVNETLPLRSRIIPLSCYGFGGSNVHVIVRANKRESIPQLGGTGVSQQHLITTGGLPRLIVMFGRGEQQLEQFFDTLLDASSHNTRNCLTDDYLALLDSVSAGKIDRLMNYRGFCLLDARQRRLLERSVKRCDLKPLREALLEKIGDRTVATTDLGRRMHHQEALQRRCHLAFSGLGCQWAGMASGLAKLKPFWDTIKRLDELLEAYKSDGLDIVGYCLAESGGGTTGKGRHGDTTNSTGTASDRQQSLCESFVSIVAYQVAMVNLIRDTLQLKNLGALVGHSLGEVSCAYAAGLFDEREAIMVAYQLGKTLDGLKPLISGKMVAIVGLDWQEVAKVVALHGDIYQTLRISCINGPNSVTLSGRVAEVDEFMLVEMELYRNSMMVFEVSSEVALHNEAIMNKPEIREPLKRALERVLLPLTDYDRTKTSWVSSFLDQAALDSSEHKEDVQIAKQANVAYFVEMLCRPINMNTALEQLEPDSIIYELSPSNGLESQINQLRYTPIESAGTGSEGRRKSSCSSLASSSAGGGSSTNALTRRAGACGSLRRASAMDQSKRKFHYIKCMQRGLDPDKQLIRVLSSLGELYQTGATFKLANLYTAQTGSQVQFPVRRQTPSLSSLISWDHSSSLFVPRYPIQFSKSSAKCEIPIDIVQDRDKYLTGHCIDGRVLYPATAYLLMIWRVFSFTKRKIYDACFQNVERELMPIEFRDVRLLRAVILGQRLAQLYVHFEEATGKFEVKEGGSVVVEGYAVSPEENPQGLLYDEVRERMVKEKKQEKESAAKTTDTNNPITEVFELSKDDVYKQFRVNGYDYGDSFQCIESSSFDGRVSRIKFNGHFVSLTDSILQSIFLTITRCAPASSLFLPTRFDYVRFQPEMILKRLREVGMSIDQSDGSLDTKAKREMMSKIMEREGARKATKEDAGDDEALDEQDEEEEADDETQADEKVKEDQQKPECIFETYCDTTTGIIITDGIEMRGIKASPAPRRVDNEVLMESYQFVRDREQPVDDERLTQFSQLVKPYARTCDSMSLELLIKLFKLDSSKSLNGLLVENNEVDSGSKMKSVLLDQHEIEAYKREYLECIYDDQETLVERTPIQEADSSSPKGDSSNSGNNNKTTSNYDIKKNGKRTLMSIMDQLLGLPSLSIERLRELVQENRNHLLKDLLQMSFTSERYVRPLIEAVVENCCIKKSKLRLLEINLDDGIMCQSLQQLIQQIEPGLALDYTLAHPQPNRLHGSQTSTTATTTSGQGRQASQASSATRTYTLKPDNIESLFSDHQLKGLDLVVFKDSSCYRPPSSSNGSDTSGVTEANTKDQLERTLATIGQSLKPGGYCMVLMRQEMTLAERVMVALSEPELVGLDQGENKPTMAAGDNEFAQLVKGVEQMNLKLEERYNKLLEASEKSLPKKRLLHLISTRSDRNGCVMLLFRLIGGGSSLDSHAGGEGELQSSSDTHTNDVIDAELQAKPVARVLIRVRHDNLDWLDELKAHFKQKQAEEEGEGENTEEDQRQNHSGDDNGATDEKTGTTEAANSHQQEKPGEGEGEEEEKQVWLCAVATKQNPINGLVGMMQSLRKELGSARLRCFYDAHTFAQLDESLVTLDRIEASECFQEALKRDHIWNCVDNQGQFGAYRHFTINDYLSYEDCLCSRQKKAVVVAAEEARQQLESQPELIEKNNSSHRELVQSGAYANNMIRGDLSSFAWFEAPYKHLSRELRRDRLVRVAYSALNFRDIMLATGRLPLDSLPLKLAMSDCQLGLEFSGLDGRGRRIMGMSASRGIATHVYLRPESSIKLDVPDWLDLSEAATIPVVYATAIMAIVCRGRARAGESILIHAGSGGVGQAAIRLALHFGLEVFTTVGSQEKRQFLLDEFGSLGLSPERIYNSRTCEFEHQIMESTRGRGVDLILNSLADDKLQASLNCLADNGRFLEIGKYDISIDTRLELLKLDVNKSFHGILVDKLFDEDDVGESFKNQLRQVKQVLEDGLKRGYIKPINYRVFKRQEVEEAFRYMATGKHIGKVLIEIDASINHPRDAVTYEGGQGVTREDPLRSEACRALKMVPRCQLSPVKSFIVTGGLGGFGLELCKWLVDQGARQLVITSRSGLRTGYQRAVLRRLETTGVKILIVTEREADACKPEGARQLLQMASELAPSKRVGGIFHLAMVLRDTLLENMSQEDFELVLAPKVAACSCLDAALDELGELGSELDYFVAFSSITSGKGNAGQANYAYANSCLERICERRRARGQHGLAIQWGAIGDVGVAYEHLGGNDVVIGGTIPQRIPSCLQTLGKLLCSPFAVCMSVVPVNRGQDGLSERGDLVGAIMHVLGIKDPSKVSEDATLGDLGLDSLMAVEIRQYIEREHDITLNIQEIRALTIARIREISETSEKTSSQAQAQTAASSSSATAAGATASDEPQKKQAANYGKQQTSTASQGAATRKTSKGTASGAAGKMALAKATAAASDASAAAKQSRFASLDKSLVSSFVPALELPADDFCHLNKHLPKADSGGGDDQEARPLFFLPPIHGQFDKLVSLCAHIKRPCVGLNWTRKLGQAQSVEEAVEICLNLLEQSDWQTQFRLRGSNPSAGDATTNEPNGTTNHQRRPSLTAQQQGGMHNNRAINNNSGHGEESRVQVVDLVGYSFGATIAFELMVAMERKYAQYSNRLERRLSNGNTQRPTMSAELEADWRQSPGGRGNQRNILKPGRLVLLDGSPKQIEMGSQYLAELTRKRPLKLEDKVDELLMVYMISNARSMGADRQQQHNNSSSNHKQQQQQQQQQQSATGLDYWSILKELKRRTELRAKVEFASGELAKLLMASNNSSGNNESFNGNGRKQQSSLARTNESTGKRMNGGEEEKLPHAAADMKTKQQSIFYAMEAFLRRYELINSYKAKSRLANDCTLIRAEKIYLRPANEDDKAPVTKRRSENGRRLDGGEHITRTAASGGPPKVTKFNEDLDLTSVVMGRVDLYIMSGDHETFLSENEPEIGRIIANAAGSGRTGADTGRQLVVQRAEPGA